MRYQRFAVAAVLALTFAGTASAQGTQASPAPAAPQAPPPASPKPAAKPATAPKPSAKTPQKPAGGHAEPAARRTVAGGPTFDDARLGAESPELTELSRAERELFPPAMPGLGTPWPTDLASPVPDDPEHPRAHASGLPPQPANAPPLVAEGGRDVSWLAKLDMPDLPVRWDPRVVRYIEFFKDDPRGRAVFAIWLRRSGRYRETIRKTLRKKGLPEDLMYLAMIESGFEAAARSPVGAQGVWQFMPETGRIYGLTQDRWADQRLNVQLATEAASDYLGDLYRRFGTWELAMAAYNMGYGGIMVALRRYNTNDYWALSRAEGSLPWETTLYVPKIVALAVVGKNLATFGFKDIALESSLDGQEVMVPPQTALASVAQAAGCTTKEIADLNPELRAQRTPPGDAYPVRVPPAKAAQCTQNLPRYAKAESPTERYTVRFGETLEQIAQARGTTTQKLVELNALAPGEVVRGGTVILVPPPKVASATSTSTSTSTTTTTTTTTATTTATATATDPRPTVVVPQDVFVYPDRKRVFYRVIAGDQLPDIARTFKVAVDDIRRWNEIDPAARLIEGMTLQLFLPQGADTSQAVLMSEKDVNVVHAGSDEFFARFEEKGRKRVVVSAKPNETLEMVGRRYGVTPSLMERINRRPRSEQLKENENVVVYLPPSAPAARTPATAGSSANAKALTQGAHPELEATPEPMPEIVAPAPDLLPPLPN
jgi:membrane-bound lytic murein transglycosylase D